MFFAKLTSQFPQEAQCGLNTLLAFQEPLMWKDTFYLTNSLAENRFVNTDTIPSTWLRSLSSQPTESLEGGDTASFLSLSHFFSSTPPAPIPTPNTPTHNETMDR